MGIYTTTIVLAIIIAICYLANLYAGARNLNKDNIAKELNGLQYYIIAVKLVLERIEKIMKENNKRLEK